MASFLDTGLMSTFSVVFTFLLVYAAVWGLLMVRAPFGDDKKGLYAIIAFAAAFMLTISRPARLFIEFITPWFLVLMLVAFLIIIVVSIFGNVDWLTVAKDTTVYTFIIIFAAIIIIAGLGYVFGQTTLNMQTGGTPTPSGLPAANSANTIPVMTENGTVVPGGVAYSDTGVAMPGTIGATGTSDFRTNVVNTIVHPKVLGIGLIFLLSMLIVYFLSRPSGGLD